MTDLITLHTHSTFCGHAKDPLGAMVDAASRAGVRVMAATEHYPVNERFDPFKHASMPPERSRIVRPFWKSATGILKWKFC